MGENTAISWTDHTFNPWIGCTKVSPGCANCYAATQDKLRSWTPEGWGAGKPRKRTAESNWKLPLKWGRNDERKRVAALHSWPAGKPMPWARPRVFCASLADWLDDEVPIEWLADLLDLIRRTPNLDWLMLTKRPENWTHRIQSVLKMPEMTVTPETWGRLRMWTDGQPLKNVWIGTTIEDQKRADERIPLLLNTPAKVRFLSCEPLLEPINLKLNFNGHTLQRTIGQDIHWIITGGESGPGFRAFNPDWARSLRDQCKAAGVAFHMKQMGGLKPSMMPPIPQDLQIQEFPLP